MHRWTIRKNGQYSLCLILGCMIAVSLFASPNKKLKTINKHIREVQQAITSAQSKRELWETSLKKTEHAEKTIQEEITTTQSHLSLKKSRLSELTEKQASLSNQLDSKKSKLKAQIQTVYQLARQPKLKVLLDNNSFQAVNRTLIYLQYISKAQTQLINHLSHTIAIYKKQQMHLKKQYAELLSLASKQQKQQASLKHVHESSQNKIYSINKNISTHQKRLLKLTQDKKALEKMLESLRKASIKAHVSKYGLSYLKGKLPWPVKGLVNHYFGTQIAKSELTWNGTVINASAGTKVHAIAPGQVIFAKWLAGYGLLIIINHGKGYLSLYGRNQALMKKVGDWVKAKDVIATVGNTGGFQKPGLYFSIRHNKLALNPGKWCK